MSAAKVTSKENTAASSAADNQAAAASEEQLIYASLLGKGMWTGFSICVVTFFLYISRIVEPVIPIDDLPNVWGMKVKDYMHTFSLPHGWGWTQYAGKGDFMNFIGIAFLAGLTIVCYLAILPTLIKKKDTAYIVIALVEICVLLLAASGLLKTGGH